MTVEIKFKQSDEVLLDGCFVGEVIRVDLDVRLTPMYLVEYKDKGIFTRARVSEDRLFTAAFYTHELFGNLEIGEILYSPICSYCTVTGTFPPAFNETFGKIHVSGKGGDFEFDTAGRYIHLDSVGNRIRSSRHLLFRSRDEYIRGI